MIDKMTKLIEWLTGISVVFGVWITVVFNLIDNIPSEIYLVVFPLPLLLVIAFGLYSVVVVLYRVITFNDCVEAAKELKEQIEEARQDLTKHGLKL